MKRKDSNLPEIRNKLMYDLRKQGYSYEQIAKIFNLTGSTVSYACEHQANRERANKKL